MVTSEESSGEPLRLKRPVEFVDHADLWKAFDSAQSEHRPWLWRPLPTYNGFSHEERVRGWQLISWLIDTGRMLPATRCCISGRSHNLQYHCEDYAAPFPPYPLTRDIHLALHRRFRDRQAWETIVVKHSRLKTDWYRNLSGDGD